MSIKFHHHAKERMKERGATVEEVNKAVLQGEKFTAKYNRIGFRYKLHKKSIIDGRIYSSKLLEVYAAEENNDLIILTVIVKYGKR